MDDGCEGDFSILCDSWPMIFALYSKLGIKLRYSQSFVTALSNLALITGEKTSKSEVSGDSNFHGSFLGKFYFFFLEGRTGCFYSTSIEKF